MEHRLAICVPSGFATRSVQSNATKPFEDSGMQLRWAYKANPYVAAIVIPHSCFVVFGAALSAALASGGQHQRPRQQAAMGRPGEISANNHTRRVRTPHQ